MRSRGWGKRKKSEGRPPERNRFGLRIKPLVLYCVSSLPHYRRYTAQTDVHFIAIPLGLPGLDAHGPSHTCHSFLSRRWRTSTGKLACKRTSLLLSSGSTASSFASKSSSLLSSHGPVAEQSRRHLPVRMLVVGFPSRSKLVQSAVIGVGPATGAHIGVLSVARAIVAP